MQWDDQKSNVFKIAERMVKTNQVINGDKNYYWLKKKKKRAWKSYYQKLLNIEFVRDRNSLS